MRVPVSPYHNQPLLLSLFYSSHASVKWMCVKCYLILICIYLIATGIEHPSLCLLAHSFMRPTWPCHQNQKNKQEWENYKSVLLRNINIKTLKKVQANQVNKIYTSNAKLVQYLKVNIYNYHTARLKKKNHIIISIYTENHLTKFNIHYMHIPLSKLEIQGKLLNLIKSIYKASTAIIIFNVERWMDAFALRSGTRHSYLLILHWSSLAIQ